MNKSVIHIVLIVLAVLAAVYGIYVGIGAGHNYPQGSYYFLLALVFGGATKVL